MMLTRSFQQNTNELVVSVSARQDSVDIVSSDAAEECVSKG